VTQAFALSGGAKRYATIIPRCRISPLDHFLAISPISSTFLLFSSARFEVPRVASRERADRSDLKHSYSSRLTAPVAPYRRLSARHSPAHGLQEEHNTGHERGAGVCRCDGRQLVPAAGRPAGPARRGQFLAARRRRVPGFAARCAVLLQDACWRPTAGSAESPIRPASPPNPLGSPCRSILSWWHLNCSTIWSSRGLSSRPPEYGCLDIS
jgi:hypothetical protein